MALGKWIAVIAFAGLATLAPAQESTGTPEARAKVEAAKTAARTNDLTVAVAAAKEAVELDPDYLEAHNQFKMLYGRQARAASPEGDENGLIKVYEGWTAKFPDKATVWWELAESYLYKDYRKTEEYASKAIQLDPKFAQAYSTLSLVEEARGNEKKRLEYLKKAADVAPDDPSWSFYYANALRTSNPELSRKLSLDVAKRFPNHERGAQSLYWLGWDSEKQEDSIKYFEQLKAAFPPNKFNWSDSGMSGLFEIYTERDPQKAKALASEMVALMPDNKSWPPLSIYADALVKARDLIAAGKAPEAVQALEAVKLPRLQNASPYYVAKAAAYQAAEQTQKAYETILNQMGQSPSDNLKAALVKYGALLQKTPAQVSADVWALLESKSKPATDLATTRFGDEKKVSLADYRGKVVLLNFWYPFCGPCRGEFPYLQAILDKYGPKGLVIVSPNVHPAEDQLVMPYMTGMHWGFIPVHSDSPFAEKAYGARGFPANFLIDREGRVLYKPGVIRGVNAQRTLELQIEAVLEHKSGN